MRSKILVIQFRSDDAGIAAEHECLTRVLGEKSNLVFTNALKDEIHWDNPKRVLAGFDGIILAGSAELYFDGGHDEAHEGRVVTSKLAKDSKHFARYLIEHDFPTLGICFGHQLLGAAVGADIRHSPTKGKTGTTRLRVVAEGETDPLLRGMPQEFPAQYMHKDVISELPHGAVVLAQNAEKCPHAILRFAPHVYSVQFHPERSREDFIASSKRLVAYMPNNKSAEELFQDAKESERVLLNFVSLAAR